MTKYRSVRYTDDGCEVYACMACHRQWECRSFGPNFCGFCGKPFEGRFECRPQDVARWKWDRWPPDGYIPYEINNAREEQQKAYTKPILPVWVIEGAYPVWPIAAEKPTNKYRDWEIVYRLRADDCTAKEAKRLLECYRLDEGRDNDHGWPGLRIFRLRRLTGAEREKYQRFI